MRSKINLRDKIADIPDFPKLATAKLVEKLDGQVAAFLFLNELCFLKPRQVLKGYQVISLIKYRK